VNIMKFSTISNLVVVLVAFFIVSSVEGIPFRAAYKTKSAASKSESVKGYLDKLSLDYAQILRKILANRFNQAAADRKRSSMNSDTSIFEKRGLKANSFIPQLSRREMDELIKLFEKP